CFDDGLRAGQILCLAVAVETSAVTATDHAAQSLAGLARSRRLGGAPVGVFLLVGAGQVSTGGWLGRRLGAVWFPVALVFYPLGSPPADELFKTLVLARRAPPCPQPSPPHTVSLNFDTATTTSIM